MRRLEGKKIVIYGDERYVRDFLYVFDYLEIAYIVNDKESEFAKGWDIIQKEKKENIFIIICKYDEIHAIAYLEKNGFQRNRNYALAVSFFYCLDFPIRKISEEKNVYVWGTGNKAHTFFHEFVESHPEVNIAGCIDSNIEKVGKTWFRRPVYSKESIDDLRKAFYIIATTDYYTEIHDFLVAHGKRENIDFIHYTLINHWASWMMRETVYDIPRLDYICPKPFCDVELFSEGRIGVCVGIPGNPIWAGQTAYCSFYDVWHSNVMKILRLSIINGTYSFCNRKKCNILAESSMQEIDVNELHYQFHRKKCVMDKILEKPAYPRNTVFRVENYMKKAREYPYTVMCGYDKTCNLQCPSCRKEIYSASGRERDRMLYYTERMKKELFENVDRIKVSGSGEVFASNVCKSILYDTELAKKVRKIGILSNGTLFYKETADRLIGIYDEVKVFISMDGCQKETAEKLRAGTDFMRWKENMEYLGELRRKGKISFLAFNFVVQRANFREMPGFAEMCLGFHSDAVKFSRIFNWGNYSEEEFQRISMFNEEDEMLEELQDVIKNPILQRPEIYLFSWINW